jgi:hypothetical protein
MSEVGACGVGLTEFLKPKFEKPVGPACVWPAARVVGPIAAGS